MRTAATATAARHTLSYVDAANFAIRAVAPAHFGVGLRDTVCPPNTVFAAHNHYGAANGRPGRPERSLHVHPFNQHEGGDAVQTRRQLLWLREHLGPTTGHQARAQLPIGGWPGPVNSTATARA